MSKISKVVRLYNKDGADSIERSGWGGRRNCVELITFKQEELLLDSIKTQAQNGHILTIKGIRAAVEAFVKQTVSDDYLWDLFKRHDWKKKMPRPEHPKKNTEAQESFKKTSLMLWLPEV